MSTRLHRPPTFLLALALCACFPTALLPLNAGAAGPDIQTVEMQALRKTCLAEIAPLTADHAAKLKTILNKRLASYEKSLADQKRAGNITGMAVAKAGLKIFGDYKSQLEKDGDFTVQTRVRRELEKDIADFAAEKAALDRPHGEAAHALREKQLAAFRAACAAQGAQLPADAELDRLFDALTAAPPPPSSAASAHGSATQDVTTGTAGATSNAAPAVWAPAVMAANGDATEWTTVAYWTADISALDLFKTPIMDQDKDVKVTATHMMNDAPYTTRLQPLRKLHPPADCQFRVLTMRDRLPVEVETWPSARNQWQFTFRARPKEGARSLHGAEIQAGYVGAALLPLLSGKEEAANATLATNAAPAPPVSVTIKSEPPEAEVFVDGRRQRLEKTPARTPCTVQLEGGKHTLVLRKLGYIPAVFKDQTITNRQVIAVALRKDPAVAQRALGVPATRAWTVTGVKLAAGESLTITAEGTWSCGSRHEEVDGDGYPNDQRFFRYYMDAADGPRQTTDGNYGALIMRIGRDGPIHVVGKSLQMTVKEAGELLLDINESPASAARRDNAGALKVMISKGPGAN